MAKNFVGYAQCCCYPTYLPTYLHYVPTRLLKCSTKRKRERIIGGSVPIYFLFIDRQTHTCPFISIPND